MRKYEVMYILRSDLDQEVIQSSVEKFANVITSTGGEITKSEVMGKRRLAYEINKMRDGVYVLVNFTSEPATVAELDRVLKIADEVIRSMITNDVA